jgi:putative Mg2+ transporter-C (MgtC) family protein
MESGVCASGRQPVKTLIRYAGRMSIPTGLPLDSGHAIGLIVAALLGAAIGVERQLRKHSAGLHTNALVALGAAAYVIAGVLVGDASGPARVVGQVVTGVGFLCAGLIWHEGVSVRGINTAATVWCSCAVGVLAGLGMLTWAATVAAAVICANILLHYCEGKLSPDGKPD